MNTGFHLGSNFGIIILDIAKEILYNELDPEKALSVFTDNFQDMPRDIALKLLSGEYIIKTLDNGNVNVVERTSEDVDYPEIDLKGIVENQYQEFILNDGNDYCGNKMVSYTEDLLQLSKSTITCYYYGKSPNSAYPEVDDIFREFEISGEVKISDLFYLVDLCKNEEDYNDLLDKFSVSHSAFGARSIITNYRFITETCLKIIKVESLYKFICTNYPGVFENEFKQSDSRYSTMFGCAKSILSNFNLIKSGGYVEIRKPDLVDSYLKDSQEIDNVLKNGIKPLEKLDKYDAYWISREGDIFGLSGSKALYLHIQMADEIVKYYNYEIPEGKDSSRYLEDIGFVKIHHDNILYSGYDRFSQGLHDLPISRKQIQVISDFGKLYYNGKIKLGVLGKELKCEDLENIVLSEYF